MPNPLTDTHVFKVAEHGAMKRETLCGITVFCLPGGRNENSEGQPLKLVDEAPTCEACQTSP